MTQENNKKYQIIVRGIIDPQTNKESFIQNANNTSQFFQDRGLTGGRFLDLTLIENYTVLSGVIGGPSSGQQTTMFESANPFYFTQLAKEIDEGRYESMGKVTRRTADGGTIEVPQIKLHALLENVHIKRAEVKDFYLAFKRNGTYDLQYTGRLIGTEEIETPSTLNWVSVVLIGSDVDDVMMNAAINAEMQRMNVEAFNCDNIKSILKEANLEMSKETFAQIAQTQVKKFYGVDEKPKVTVTEGEATGQPATQPATGQAQAEPAAKVVGG